MEIKLFSKFTAPIEPFKRELTEKEQEYLFENFDNFSWSHPDKLGRIILGGGHGELGVYFITLIDLELAMEVAPNHSRGYYVPPYSTNTTTAKSSWSKLGVEV